MKLPFGSIGFPFKTLAGQLAAYLTGVVVVAYMIVAATPRNWGVQIPSVTHTYGIRLTNGVDLFFRPWVGWFIEHGGWACFASAVAALLIEYATRALTRSRSETF